MEQEWENAPVDTEVHDGQSKRIRICMLSLHLYISILTGLGSMDGFSHGGSGWRGLHECVELSVEITGRLGSALVRSTRALRVVVGLTAPSTAAVAFAVDAPYVVMRP